MKSPLVRLGALLLVAILFAHVCAAEVSLPAATVVVYNSAVPESFELARFYAEHRGIPRDHLVAIRCSTEEEISRDEYDATIAQPLRAVFAHRNWWTVHTLDDGQQTLDGSTIRFVALIKGMPLKIKAAENYLGDRKGTGPIGDRNEAAVDSEIAVLGFFSRQISGATNNPYYKSYRAITAIDNPAFLLVSRLDAPSFETAKRMITDAIEAEKTGLWGRAYVDGMHNTSGALQIGDQWLSEICDQLHKNGVPVVFDDTPELFPEGYPMSDCALYYGWYAGSVTGPFVRSDFRFVPGAIAVHIHSYSGATLRSDNSYWVGPLVTAGAAATIGNVYEPYLQLTSNLSILNDRLLHGFTFAESAYMSLPAISWMTVIVGDPLYRPYASWLQLNEKSEPTLVSDWKKYHDFVLKFGEKPRAEFRAQAKLAAARAHNGTMLEDLGLMDAADGNFVGATNSFEDARAFYTKRDDILRAALDEVGSLVKEKKSKRALDLVRVILRSISDSPTKALFTKLESQLSATASPPPKKKPNE